MKMNVMNMPDIKTTISKSKDGKWIIHKTEITDIRASNYYKTVLEEVSHETVR